MRLLKRILAIFFGVLALAVVSLAIAISAFPIPDLRQRRKSYPWVVNPSAEWMPVNCTCKICQVASRECAAHTSARSRNSFDLGDRARVRIRIRSSQDRGQRKS